MDEHFFKLSFILFLIIFIITAIFCWNLYTILGKLPKENQKFPRWFVWLFLVPWIGFVFQWIMIPFGIPNAIRKTFPTNQEIINEENVLFQVGLANIIFTTFGIFFAISPINQIAAVAGIALWAAYWILIIRFKKKRLNANSE